MVLQCIPEIIKKHMQSNAKIEEALQIIQYENNENQWYC